MKYAKFALAVIVPTALAAGFSHGQEASATAAAGDAAAMVGAEAVIVRALDALGKGVSEEDAKVTLKEFTSEYRRIENGQYTSNGRVAPAEWLAAVDLALAVDSSAAYRFQAFLRFQALLSIMPGPDGWDAIRSGLRDRADKLAAEAGNGAADARSRNARVIVLALLTAVDYLAEGCAKAPGSLDELAAIPSAMGLNTDKIASTVAELRRGMDCEGDKGAFDLRKFLRDIQTMRRKGYCDIKLPEELAELPDDEFAKVASLLLAPASDGEDSEWSRYFPLRDLPAAVVSRLADAAKEMPRHGQLAWMILGAMLPGPEKRELFDALVAAHDPLEDIRALVADAADNQGDDEEDDDSELVGFDDFGDFVANLGSCQPSFAMVNYVRALLALVGSYLDADDIAEAEGLVSTLSNADWFAVFKFSKNYCPDSWVERPTEAWRKFTLARLPEGEALLDSPFLDPYFQACLPDRGDEFESECARLLGAAADGEKAKKRMEEYRFILACLRGDLDAAEKHELPPADGTPLTAESSRRLRRWCEALEAIGDAARLGKALDLAVAAATAQGDSGDPGTDFNWAVPVLARARRFADAEALAALGMSSRTVNAGASIVDFSSDGLSENPAHGLLYAYLEAGRTDDALGLVNGWPHWPATGIIVFGGTDLDRRSLPALVARTLRAAGGEANASNATAIARAAVSTKNCMSEDWPYEILVETMDAENFRALMDYLSKIDPYEERPVQWKAESFRREGDLEAAEEAARRAVKIDPTDGEAETGERIRSYGILAQVLEDKGTPEGLEEAATLRRVVAAVRAAEKGDQLNALDYLTHSIAKYDEAAGLFEDAYCVQWRLAERLRAAGRIEEAVAHYEETFRHMPAQFGQVASLCFGCANVFSGAESASAAERILPALASSPDAGPQVHYLLGELREAQGRHEEAFDEFSKALELDPGYFDALKKLLGLKRKVNRPDVDWTGLRITARRLDPFLRNHYEAAGEIEDFPRFWRAWDELAATLPAPPEDTPGVIFRFAAAKGPANGEDPDAESEDEEFFTTDGYELGLPPWVSRPDTPAKMLRSSSGEGRLVSVVNLLTRLVSLLTI